MPAIERFGRYELLRRLDVGGMGEVFVARERLGGGARLVALKRLLPQVVRDERYVEMFLDEIRLAALIDHPGICRLFDHGEVEGEHYMAMEWVHGVSLKAMLERCGGGLPVPVVIRVLADVAAALEHTHRLADEGGRSLEVIHRDITPPNIMVSFAGETKLLDFGLARARTQEHHTDTGYIKGKLRYLAPEQLEDGREFDWRVDVFTLGLCGYEALVGRHLFDAASPADAVIAIQDYEGPPRVRDRRPDTPEVLAAIIERAIARRPALRFQTVARMQEALEAALAVVDRTFGSARLADFVTRLFPDEAEGGGLQ